MTQTGGGVGGASPLSFGFFTVALVAMAALAFEACLQFPIVDLRERDDATHVAFRALCECVAARALGSAPTNAAHTLASALCIWRMLADGVMLDLRWDFIIGVDLRPGMPTMVESVDTAR